jgi:hypothetical protein
MDLISQLLGDWVGLLSLATIVATIVIIVSVLAYVVRCSGK